MKKKLTRFFHTYGSFTRTEQNGVFVLLIILLILTAIKIYLQKLPPESAAVNTSFKKELEAWYADIKEKDSINIPSHRKAQLPGLFAFNPNTVVHDDLLKLGFYPWLAKRMITYREKGGQFKKPEDLKKLYGMSPEFYERIRPFIRIEPALSAIPAYKENRDLKKNTEILKIELNHADSVELLKLRGIGPAFASRIVRYRKLLGGFVNNEQLLEVYGFRTGMLDTIAEKIDINRELIKKISINTADEKTLYDHPYIRKKARIIINYRNLHGKFSAVVELEATKAFQPNELEKLKPYLSFD